MANHGQPTLYELASESIGRISRRGLEPKIAQAEQALAAGERPIALAHGVDGARAVLIVVTDRRLLLSSGVPFATPELEAFALAEVTGAAAAVDGEAWTLRLTTAAGERAVSGMFDRDAQRIERALAD